MNAMVVGADRLGNIPDLLEKLGITIGRHISGRSPSHQKTVGLLPRNLDLLILFTDFLNHNAMRNYRAQARAQGIRVVACRRSASCLMASVSRDLGLSDCAEFCPLTKK